MTTTTGTPLSPLDRCDRCGAAAMVRAVLAGDGGELLFCGHHARLHGPQLVLLRARLSLWHTETHTSSRPGIPTVPAA